MLAATRGPPDKAARAMGYSSQVIVTSIIPFGILEKRFVTLVSLTKKQRPRDACAMPETGTHQSFV